MIFCIKQKTAYELRISDWSSDVCSSDLRFTINAVLPDFFALKIMRSRDTMNRTFKRRMGQLLQAMFKRDFPGDIEGRAHQPRTKLIRGLARHTDSRSEEHTSELQSLMRISYADFCLQKNRTAKDLRSYAQTLSHEDYYLT